MKTRQTSEFHLRLLAVGFCVLLLACAGCQIMQPSETAYSSEQQNTKQADPEDTAAYMLWWITYYGAPFLTH
jgi:hypothetical protein